MASSIAIYTPTTLQLEQHFLVVSHSVSDQTTAATHLPPTSLEDLVRVSMLLPVVFTHLVDLLGRLGSGLQG